MKDYSFWYSETYTYKGFFKAKNLKQAKDLLSQVFYEGELDINDLPEFGSKDKNYEAEYSPETLEEID